ncbi:transcription elongation factor SPT6 homolog isoform X2 [Tasmannia lanceolata]|uniref:transcription elongation factor SPT6 homolog isoform X2 n=1 Tax=Tasmannia lanceolata TaxID=3420 RepID=UPI004063B462
MADFIVDEEEVDKNGAPVRRRKPCKKKSRPAIGVSSSALQEAREIFVVVNELLMLRKQRFAKGGSYDDFGEWREKRLEDEFEPFILTEKYMTEKDDRIRKIDVPERIQVIDQYRDDQKVDLYYKKEESSLQSEQEKDKKLAKKYFKPRMIVHPRFQNFTVDEAMEFLSDKDAGESIIHPSVRGPSYLTLTLKISDGVYSHKDIFEGGKEHKDITSLLCLGKTLKIGDDTFEDLDEVMDRYVDKLVTHLKTMLAYHKFRRGSKAEVDNLLRMEKAANPMRIVYCFGISHEHPGTFILSYIRSTNPHYEYIGLHPKGFRFRSIDFENIDSLVAYFQRHNNDLQLDSMPPIRSVAGMVQMRSLATGGSSNGFVGADFCAF